MPFLRELLTCHQATLSGIRPRRLACPGIDPLPDGHCRSRISRLDEGRYRARLFAAYVYGSLAILAANIVRIGLLVIIGNRIAPAYATGEFHVNAGWLFFAAIYTCIVIGSYRWMLQRTATRS